MAMQYSLRDIDRISLLPTELLRHILFFLPGKDAARTPVLSRSWHRLVWCSLPALSFDFDQDKFTETQEFVHHVDASLQRLHFERIEIVYFRLIISHLDSQISQHIDRWLQMVANNNVQELDISIKQSDIINDMILYSFPKAFCIHIGGLLKVIQLQGCSFDTSLFKSTFLEKLYLKNAAVVYENAAATADDDNEFLQRFISRCHLLEGLLMVNCSGIITCLRRISNHPNLKDITIRIPTTPSSSIDIIDEPNLDSLSLTWMPRLDNVYTNLRYLGISHPTIINNSSSSVFENLETNFPCLIGLGLMWCTGLSKVASIKHSGLEELLLCSPGDNHQLTIDTPKLVCLRDVTSLQVSEYRFAMNIDATAAAGIFLSSTSLTHSSSLPKLMKFVTPFNKYNFMIGKNPWPVRYEFSKEVRRLTLLTSEVVRTERVEDFVDELFWTCQPEILVVTPKWRLYHALLKVSYTYQAPAAKDSLCFSCSSDAKCPHHKFIKDIKIDQSATTPDQESLPWLQTLDDILVFKLKWV